MVWHLYLEIIQLKQPNDSHPIVLQQLLQKEKFRGPLQTIWTQIVNSTSYNFNFVNFCLTQVMLYIPVFKKHKKNHSLVFIFCHFAIVISNTNFVLTHPHLVFIFLAWIIHLFTENNNCTRNRCSLPQKFIMNLVTIK